MSIEQIALVLLAVNAAVCASVPAEVKFKAPVLWGILDALAANVGHATNRLDVSKPWQKGIAAAVLAAVLASFGASVAGPAPSVPVDPLKLAQPVIVPSVAVPAVLEPAAVSPSEAASSATAVAQ